MPDLGWEATEEIETQENTKETAQEKSEINKMAHTPPQDNGNNSDISPNIHRDHQITHTENTRNLQKNSASGKKRNQENQS